jgi:hypothetical protein
VGDVLMIQPNALGQPYPTMPQPEPYSHVSPEFRARIPGIFAGESGGDYGALYGFSNRPGGQFENVRLTDMTINQALEFANPRGDYGRWVANRNNGTVATPMGAYQIVGSTMRAARDAMGLTGDEPLTPEMQDRLAQWIYENQGIGAWVGYRPGVTDMPTPPAGAAPHSFDGRSSGRSSVPSMPDGATYGGGMMAGNALALPPEVVQQVQERQSLNALQDVLQRPIYNFQMQGGSNALGSML